MRLAARLALCAWTALTAIYAMLCSVPFIWLHFVAEKFYPAWVGVFLRAHPILTIAALGLAAAALREEHATLDRRWGRRAWTALAVVTALFFVARPLAGLEIGAVARALTALSALPLLSWELVVHARSAPAARAGEGGELQRLLAAWCAGALCAAAAHVGLRWAAPAWTPAQTTLVFSVSLAAHLLTFSVAWAALEAARGARWAALAFAWFPGAALIGGMAFAAVGFSGAAAYAAAAVWSAAIVAAARPLGFAPSPLARGLCLTGGLLILAGSRAALGANDWNGLFGALFAALAWAGVFAALRPTSGDRPSPGPALAACLTLLGLVWTGSLAAAALDPALRLRGLAPGPLSQKAAALDASFKLARRALRVDRPDGGFFALLQKNTNIPREDRIAPVEILLADSVVKPAGPLPHVFIIVVDSLRPDYLGLVSPSARTPAIDALARDGVYWKNAFTAYGGTSLSEPSIWAGALLVHQQYVTPFRPMNALLRLVETLEYRLLLTKDTVVRALLPDTQAVELDERVTSNYLLCNTLAELDAKLETLPRDKPLFVYTQPQDVHVSVIEREKRSNVTGHDYPGLDAAVASRVERLDACLGAFVAGLKKRGLYDDSVIVLTADHGDSLGEEGRWGHAYTLFPEILRVPLVIKLPAALKKDFKFDLDGPAFLIDLTPTLYQLLGQGPPRLNPLFGRPLAARASDPAQWRKKEQLVVSSYGPVYGTLEEGRRLFVADGVDFRYHLYDLAADPGAKRDLIDAAQKKRGETAVRGWLERLNAFWKRP